MSEVFVDITAESTGPDRTGRVRRWLTGPPGGLMAGVAALNVALTLFAASAPGSYAVPLVIAVAVWAALGLTFLVRAGLTLALGEAVGPHRWRWLAGPLVLAVTATLLATAVPVRSGLALASSDMIRFAQDQDAVAPARVGPYSVTEAEHLAGGGARFLISGTGFLDHSGFVYSPYTPPPRIGEDTYQHLRGPWYVWTESW